MDDTSNCNCFVYDINSASSPYDAPYDTGHVLNITAGANSCGVNYEDVFTSSGQIVAVFYTAEIGEPDVAMSGSVLTTNPNTGEPLANPSRIIMVPKEIIRASGSLVVCGSLASFFCCSDDYNKDGVIDALDSAIYKCWVEDTDMTGDLSVLQNAYEDRVKEDTGWPVTTPCSLPKLPCGDFDLSEAHGLTDSDMHTAATHLYGNVSRFDPPTDGFSIDYYYPKLQGREEWADDAMVALPSVFSTAILENDSDISCPDGGDFHITVEGCSDNDDEQTLCLYNDNDLDDYGKCTYQNDFDYRLHIRYQGPYIRLSDVHYELKKDGKVTTARNINGTPGQTLEDIITAHPGVVNNDLDVPGVVTLGSTKYYSNFQGDLEIDSNGVWEIQILAEDPNQCAKKSPYSVIKEFTAPDCTLKICEDDFPGFGTCSKVDNSSTANDVE